MAEKRMFAKTIIDSDAFLDMPLSTQALYFHLSMRADDEGFVNNPKKIMRMVGATQNELEILLVKKFIIAFESGVIVIKHWKIHNYIRKDRIKETVYQKEKRLMTTKNNGAYTLSEKICQTDVGQTTGERQANVGIDKIRLDKISIDNKYIVEIVNYLNEKCGTNYKTATKKTRQLIEARLKEKFTVNDFKTVIDKKANEWIGTEHEKYLRPETLFGTKFEGYLNQNINKKIENKRTYNNKFHNFDQKTKNYTAEELDKIGRRNFEKKCANLDMKNFKMPSALLRGKE